MTATLKVLVPEATTNYVLNPSFRYSETTDTDASVGGWLAVGGLIERVLDHALYGIASLKVQTSGVVPREGVYYRVSSLVGISEPITASVYVRGAGIVHLRLIESGGKEWVSEAQALHSDRWVRFEVSGFSTGSNDMSMYVETDIRQPSITFYVDGAQMERKPYATSFCDGDQDGCRWNIVDSASVSTRPANTREGGRWVELAGPCRENDDIYVTVLGGLGMPPIQNNTQSWALTPGSYFQNTKVLDRVVNISFSVKNVKTRVTKKTDSSPLHKMRQQLIDVFKSDVTAGDEAFIFSYQEGDRELFIRMRYESGLEGNWDIRNQWIDTMNLRFVAVDPVFWENNQNAQEIKFQDSFLFYDISGRINGRWTNLNYGFDNSINVIKKGKRNYIYAGGTFTKANNSLSAIDPMIPAKRIAYWDGIKWNLMGTGADNEVYDISFDQEGKVYAGGAFTNIGGIAANRIARWDGNSWAALPGGGAGNYVKCICFAPNGVMYVGGVFQTIGTGSIPANFVARWDGASWHAIGAHAGVDNIVYSLDISKDGSEVYIGGSFHDEFGVGGTALNHVAKYTVATNTFSAMGSGLDADLVKVKISPKGILYATGAFTHSGTTDINRIAKWNGSAWVGLGEGAGGTVGPLEFDDQDRIYVSGSFVSIGGISAPGIAFWNGSSWVHTDIYVGRGDPDVYQRAFLYSSGDLYLGGDHFHDSNSLFSAINTITNFGTMETRPIIYIYGPGRLRWIENQTTKKTIYLDMTILDNEEVFFDFGKGTVWSTVRGALTYAVLPGSDFADFSLAPGENTLAVFMTNDVDSKMYVYYQPRHWSADSTVKVEAL